MGTFSAYGISVEIPSEWHRRAYWRADGDSLPVVQICSMPIVDGDFDTLARTVEALKRDDGAVAVLEVDLTPGLSQAADTIALGDAPVGRSFRLWRSHHVELRHGRPTARVCAVGHGRAFLVQGVLGHSVPDRSVLRLTEAIVGSLRLVSQPSESGHAVPGGAKD